MSFKMEELYKLMDKAIEGLQRTINSDNEMDYKLIDNIEIDGIDTKDYPDFSNAYIVSADYNGVAMNNAELDEVNDNQDFQYECIMNELC
tara:strand:+ start:168 stop:437 length:270 start_codon:yes stop_codon:yes gene_type:complete